MGRPEKDLQGAKDEVHRKIGRNMLMFQHMELMLKFLIANGQFSGSIDNLKENIERQNASVSKKTMGSLVGEFLESTHKEQEEPEDIGELYTIHMSFNFRIDCDEVYYEKRKKKLAEIVSQRNDLVHHLLPRFNLQSIESCVEIEQYLDEQHKQLEPEVENLKRLIKSFQKTKKELFEYVASEEYWTEMRLSELRHSRLVMWLGQIAEKAARKDGWTYLNTAGQVLQTQQPEELANFKKLYGYKSLKEIILAPQLFDFMEEKTEKGGVRVMYRLKEGWELSSTLTKE